MKQKKLLSIITLLTVFISLMPGLPAKAFNFETKFKPVTSAEEIVSGAKYIIVGRPGYDTDPYEYYALSDEATDDITLETGRRSAVPLVLNDDNTLSLPENYSNSVYPFLMIMKYDGNPKDGLFSMYVNSNLGPMYLDAFYSTVSQAYTFDHTYSKSLPIAINSNGYSIWQPIFRPDGTVLFKTTKKYSSLYKSAYIRMYHYASEPYFSGGFIDDTDIDLPNGQTTGDLNEENIPVKTYLYKEVCTHDEAYLTHTSAKDSTCSEHGNIEYYYCSNCCGYLNADKSAEITQEDTVLELAPHTNTIFYKEKAAACTEHGNIAYTVCSDCGGVFEGNETNTEIDINDVGILASGHSYADGICSVCGTEAVTSYFGSGSSYGDGTHSVFVAKYNDIMYAMGMPNEKGMSAVEVTMETANVFKACNDTAAFADIEYGETIKDSDNYYYTQQYIKFGPSYLKNTSETLKLVCTKENATYWRNSCDNMYDDTDSQKYICLVVNDGEPYFSVSNVIDENHIKANTYSEKCHHKDGLIHSEYIAPTCYINGVREYWTYNVCGLIYSDSKGLTEIWNKDDLILLALGAKDNDGNDICDYCGKNMPVFTKVTSADEIVMQNKYLLVAEYAESYYAMAPIGADSKGEKGSLSDSTMLPAVSVSVQEDGTIKYKNADDRGAFIFTTDFAAECCDLDNGEIRYSLQGMVNGSAASLADSFGEFNMLDAYAKYGYRIDLNDDGTVKIKSVYNESWEGTDNGYLRFYNIDGQRVFSLMQKNYYEELYKGASVSEGKKLYLYRMTENGIVTNTDNEEQRIPYRINDSASVTDFKKLIGDDETATDIQKAAAGLSNVSGMSDALTQAAINDTVRAYVKDWNTANALQLDMNVNISVKEYTEGNPKEGTVSAITFSLKPKMTITDNTQKQTVDIDDSAFDGLKQMKISLYVGSMYPQEIIHIKQDGTKEYFYSELDPKVERGEAAAFSLSETSNGNWVQFSVTEFSDVIVSDTKSLFAINDYYEYDGTAVVFCPKAGDYTLIFADYEGNSLNNVVTVSQSFDSGENYVSKPKDSDIDMSVGDKLFLWTDTKSLVPLCGAYVISNSESK